MSISKKTQSSLDGFLGLPTEKKKVAKQTKLESFVNITENEPESKSIPDQPVVTPPDGGSKKEYRDEKPDAKSDRLQETDDEQPQEPKRILTTNKRLQTANARSTLKRRKVEQETSAAHSESDEPQEIEMGSESDRDFQPSSDEKDEDDSLAPEGQNSKEPINEAQSTGADELKQKKSKTKPASGTITKSKRKGTGSKKKSEMSAKEVRSDKELTSRISWTGNVSYRALCETFESIDEITGRLEIQNLLTELFRQVILTKPRDLYDLIYLASNSVAPAYECIELGIGDAILIKAIGEAYGTNPSMVKKKYESEGDLGTVAKVSKGKQRTLGFGAKPKNLLAKEVLAAFREIAKKTGTKSQKFKVDKIKGLLVRAQGPEAKYIIRGLQGKLRIGLAQSTVLVSLAHAIALTSPPDVKTPNDTGESTSLPEEANIFVKEKVALDVRLDAAAAIVKKAYSEVPSYDSILDAALSVPLQYMHTACSLTPGIPVTPMLAKPTKSIQEVLKRLNGQRFTCEFKYDGERAQVHMTPDGTAKVFSRNLLNTTEKFPEVPIFVKKASKDSVKSFVLDTEVVAFNRETNQFVPFQVLSTRKKAEESAETAKVQVIVQAFDLMYLNGVSLLNATLSERRNLLRSHFTPVDGKFQFATSLDHTEDGDTDLLENFLDTAVKGKCEGLMVKTLDTNAVYEPSRRSLNWLKLKKDYIDGLGDSFDLVPLGAYHGKGKRTGVYGAYLMACYDEDKEEFQSVCKIGTGLTEKELKVFADSFKDNVIEKKDSQYNVSDALECDVWFDAVQVWEVQAADLSTSSTHRGAVGRSGDPDRGIGLRFPRFERVRSDKKPEEATSSQQILEMYYKQDSVADDEGEAGDDDGI